MRQSRIDLDVFALQCRPEYTFERLREYVRKFLLCIAADLVLAGNIEQQEQARAQDKDPALVGLYDG